MRSTTNKAIEEPHDAAKDFASSLKPAHEEDSKSNDATGVDDADIPDSINQVGGDADFAVRLGRIVDGIHLEEYKQKGVKMRDVGQESQESAPCVNRKALLDNLHVDLQC